MLRDHGPPDPYLKLAVFTVNAFMNDKGPTAGTCFPSQESIAAASGLGVRTVRRKLAEASRLGWIAMFERARAGQRWKAIMYRACVPDGLDVSPYKHADPWKADHGPDIPVDALLGTLYPQRKRSKAPATAAGPSTSRAGTQDGSTGRSRPEDRPLTHEAPATDDIEDRPERPTKFLEEVPRGSSYVEGHSPSGSRPASDMHAIAKHMKPTRAEESLEVRLRKARTLLVADPKIGEDLLRSMYGLTAAQASEARRAAT